MANSISTYREAVKKIAANLNLKGGDKHSQDWEYEVADPNKIEDFLKFYKNNKLDTVEKRILIKLLLESYNDYVGEKGFILDYTKNIKKILEKEKTLFESGHVRRGIGGCFLYNSSYKRNCKKCLVCSSITLFNYLHFLKMFR